MRQAFKVVAFVKRHEKAPMIAAHCDYGVSRSGAVAEFVRLVHGAPLEKDAEGKNRLVFRRLLAAQAVSCLKSLDIAAAARALSWLGRQT